MAVRCDDARGHANWNEYVPICQSLPGITTDSNNKHIRLDRLICDHDLNRDCAFKKRLRLDQNCSEIIHISPCWPRND